MRKIVISSTFMPTATVIESSATTRQELVDQLGEQYGKLQDMNLMIGETCNTLSLPESVLPEEDFTLFIMPKVKTSAGADRKELYSTINEFVEKYPDAKVFFKNFTRISNDTLTEMIEEFKTENSVVKTKGECTPKSEAICNNVKNATPNASSTDLFNKLNEIAHTDYVSSEDVHPFVKDGVPTLQGIIRGWVSVFNSYNYNLKAKLNSIYEKLKREG